MENNMKKKHRIDYGKYLINTWEVVNVFFVDKRFVIRKIQIHLGKEVSLNKFGNNLF